MSTAVDRFGSALTRDAAVYGAGRAVSMMLSVVNLAVMTRLLAPAEFGRLALLVVFAATVTLVLNMAVLRGSFRHVFGGGGVGDDDGGDDDGDDDESGPIAANRRRALGTALILSAIVALAGAVAVAVFAGPFDDLITGSRVGSPALIWAGASGALGSVWRLVTNILRFERRPTAYTMVNTLRPISVLGVSIPLVASGGGVTGAVAGLALGTAVAIVATLVITRRSYQMAFDRRDAALIVRASGAALPLVLGMWVVHHADIYILSAFASQHALGEYRAASRMGAVALNFVSTFFMAWGPLTRGDLHRQMTAQLGRGRISALLARYYLLVAGWLLIGLAGFSGVLIRVAAASYEQAAPLVPLTGAAFLSYGGLVVVNRTSRFPQQRRAYIAVVVGAGLSFVPVSIVLIRSLGSYGAPLAQLVAYSSGALVLLALARRAGTSAGLEGRALLRIGLLVAVFLAVALATSTLPLSERVGVAFGLVAAFPVAALAIGALPRSHLGTLRAIARSLRPARRRRETTLELDRVAEYERRS